MQPDNWRFLGPVVAIAGVGAGATAYVLGGIGPAAFAVALALMGAGGRALLIRRQRRGRFANRFAKPS